MSTLTTMQEWTQQSIEIRQSYHRRHHHWLWWDHRKMLVTMANMKLWLWSLSCCCYRWLAMKSDSSLHVCAKRHFVASNDVGSIELVPVNRLIAVASLWQWATPLWLCSLKWERSEQFGYLVDCAMWWSAEPLCRKQECLDHQLFAAIK